LAITKERKLELIKQYREWMERSRALIVTEYTGLSMSQIDELRQKLRESGGEFHIIKNTLGEIAVKEAGMPVPEHYFEGSTAISFAFDDAPSVAKTMTEFARKSDFVKIKGGYLGTVPMTTEQIKALADLPPLPVMRAQLLGTLLAPASQLVRILAEPGRQVAAVIKAYADRDAIPETATEAG
jgi:large subunit ribosomal protein L10